MSGYDIPGKIVQDAVNMYVDVFREDTLKAGKRRAAMAITVYHAYMTNNIAKDPVLLGLKFGTDIKALRRAQGDLTDRIHAYDLRDKYPVTFLQAWNLLHDYVALGLLDVDQREILEDILVSASQESHALCRIQPRIVGLAAIAWLQSMISRVDISEHCRMYHVPKATTCTVMQILSMHMS